MGGQMDGEKLIKDQHQKTRMYCLALAEFSLPAKAIPVDYFIRTMPRLRERNGYAIGLAPYLRSLVEPSDFVGGVAQTPLLPAAQASMLCFKYR